MPKPPKKPLPVVLLTDFGPHSPYVGQMKLVLERAAPGARVIDLAHDLPAHDLAAAVLVLSGAQRYLPEPCVLCAVVDPGVGSARRIVAARFANGVRVLCPGNGLLAAFAPRGRPQALHAVTNKRHFLPEVSPVFHGRDVFAPVAAALAQGLDPKVLGPRVDLSSLAPAPWPAPKFSKRDGTVMAGQVVHTDRFGNLVTNVPAYEVRARKLREARIGRLVFPLREHYAEVAVAKPVALVGSYGFLELALRERSAAARTGAKAGTKVILR
ncbi:MAG: SAM-dependent chlorinase/fluorinase [Planctomycetes bacterium]|nr:SAM-dependent chlorinase/fluorinase [Planctomycetota bacterium]